MQMADADTLQTRKAHHADADSSTVPMVDSHSDTDQYPNPFRHTQEPRQQHYNVMIPTVDHWPALFLQGLQTSARYTLVGLRQLHAKIQEYSANSSGTYRVLPTTNLDSRPHHQQQQQQRQSFTFGSKRQLKQGGHHVSCTGRQLTRIFFVLVLVVITIVLLVLPHQLNPLEDRAVWIRYYNHEEAITIPLPYGRQVHVSDVKKTALKELHNGYTSFTPGNVKLISRNRGALQPDNVWDNSDWAYQSSAYDPIIAVETRYELFLFLNSTLGCFSSAREFPGDVYSAKFKSSDWSSWRTLASVLHKIAHNIDYFEEHEIFKLREGFNDPKKNDPRTGRPWRHGNFNRNNYIHPDAPLHTAMPVWEEAFVEREETAYAHF
ncbi:hypothetical protein BGX23_012531 [Mortierella sp. AD031]|nr:hypothetical protein BGX23_012531 [Mortierella sp. AD031]